MNNLDGGCTCDEEHPVFDGSACRSYGLSFVTELELADYVRDFLVDSNNVVYMRAGDNVGETEVYTYDGARWSVLGPANYFIDKERTAFSMVMDKSTNRLYVMSRSSPSTNFSVEYFDGSTWVDLGDEGFIQDPPFEETVGFGFSLALDRSGTLYALYGYTPSPFTNARVVKYDKDEGAWVSVASGELPGTASNMLIDSQGRIYIETRASGSPLLPVVDGALGEPLWSYSGGEVHYSKTVRLDSRDRIWYMSYKFTSGYQIYLNMYDPQTQENTRVASLSDALGEPVQNFWGAGMAFDDDDNMFICVNMAGYINDDPSEDPDYDYRGSFFTYSDGNLKLESRKFSAVGIGDCHMDIGGDQTPFVGANVGIWIDPEPYSNDYTPTVWMRH